MTRSGRVLGAAGIAAALTPLNSTMVAVALPALSLEFSVSASSVATGMALQAFNENCRWHQRGPKTLVTQGHD